MKTKIKFFIPEIEIISVEIEEIITTSGNEFDLYGIFGQDYDDWYN